MPPNQKQVTLSLLALVAGADPGLGGGGGGGGWLATPLFHSNFVHWCNFVPLFHHIKSLIIRTEGLKIHLFYV